MTQRLDCTTIAPAGIKALGSVYGYITQSGLPRPLVNLGFSRVTRSSIAPPSTPGSPPIS
jgi:hypothetical protein